MVIPPFLKDASQRKLFSYVRFTTRFSKTCSNNRAIRAPVCSGKFPWIIKVLIEKRGAKDEGAGLLRHMRLHTARKTSRRKTVHYLKGFVPYNPIYDLDHDR